MSQPLSFARSTRLALALTAGAAAVLALPGLPHFAGGYASGSVALITQSAETLPPNIITSADAAGHREEIDAYLDTWIPRLTGDDSEAVSEARDALVSVVVRPDATREFRQFYAELLGRKLQPAIGDAELIGRLNAAIVAHRVSRVAETDRMADLTTALVGDESAAVSLWGVKAAGPILPILLQRNAQQQELVQAVVEAVERFPDNGPLAEEAYETLTLGITGRTPPGRNVVRQGVPSVVPALHELFAFRLDRYTPEGGVPAEPMAEQKALAFIVHSFVWPEQNAEQQTRTIQLLRDMLMQATVAAGTTDASNRSDFVLLAARIGSSFVAIGENASGNGNAASVVQAATAVSRQREQSPQSELERTVEDLLEAIAASYPDLPDADTVTMEASDGGEAPDEGEPATEQSQ